jgi:stearoyl-CoA desaturase (delta-9 desaturase)
MGWIFSNHTNDSTLSRYVPDLQKDWLLVGVERSYILWVFAGLSIPALIGLLVSGGLQGAFLGFLWGGLVRVFFVHHVTWSINSICHTFGTLDYASADHSRNNLVCGVLGHGEGWHNNHHAFPNSARHGLRWWQFDLSWLVIRTMQVSRLAWNVRTPSQNALKAKCLVGKR